MHELVVRGLFGRSGDQSPYITRIYDEGLELMPGWPREIGPEGWVSPSCYGPFFADLDNNGWLEYGLSIEPFPGTQLRLWNLDGTSFLGSGDTTGYFYDLPNPGEMITQVVADLDGDDYADILFRAAGDFFAGYSLERMAAVNREAQMLPNYPALTNTEYIDALRAVPTVGDVNQDGYVDFVIPCKHKLLFANRIGNVYHPERSYWPMEGINRRHNYTMPLPNEVVVNCGDINGDGSRPNVGDLVFLVDYLFGGGPRPPRIEMANVDGSTGPGTNVNVSDLTFLVAYLFLGGLAPIC